jgi:tRNA A-37 threonylcarbamoyl transferase component Bud32
MPLFAQHPDLEPTLAKIFREEHEKLFEEATFIATNNSQVVKSFSFNGRDYVIKRYPENGPRANLRSLLGISRAMNSFNKSARLSEAGVQTPAHLFVARHLGFLKGTSYLIMEKCRGESLYPMLFEDPPRTISPLLIENLVEMTRRIHASGFAHGDLHAGNVFVMADGSVEIIDLDNLRPNLKRQKRDRARLLRSFESRPELHRELSQALNQRS